ncbi:MAG: hypothetical protein ABSD59_08945 [Terracidiphilus sp.]|jgi:hypothetical protein
MGESMFDDLETAEKKSEDEQTPTGDENKLSSGLYRWAHFPALLTFGILIILFHGHPWSWQVAIGCAYTVYVFFFAFGSVLRDLDDFFGDPRVPRCAGRLLIPHLVILALIIAGVPLWFQFRPMLPDWATHEGRKGSLWDLCGWLVLAFAGIAQGFWMAGKLKRWFGKSDAAGEN